MKTISVPDEVHENIVYFLNRCLTELELSDEDREDAKATLHALYDAKPVETITEVARKGGAATAKLYGSEHFKRIGSRGGSSRASRQDVKNGEWARKMALRRKQKKGG